MDGNTMRTLREYIHELRRRDRNNYGTLSSSGFDTTLENHSTGDQGDRSGDGGPDQNDSGQSRD
jgi:hypothetical protein